MQSDQVLIFIADSRADSPQLCHLCTDAEKQAEVDDVGSHVGTSFAAHPVDTHIPRRVVLQELDIVDSPNSQLTLDSGDQWRTLEQGTGELNFQRINDILTARMDNQNLPSQETA